MDKQADLFGIRLLGARLLVEVEGTDDEYLKSESGLYLPSDLHLDSLIKAKVVKVGEGEYNHNGVLIKPEVSVGDFVYFAAHHGGEFMGYRMIHWYAVEGVEPANS
jgi:co-chaperonin GroES (HSP10)